jgi:hypothetical protein
VAVVEGLGMRWNDRGGRGDKFVELALCQQSGVDTLTVCMLTRLAGIRSVLPIARRRATKSVGRKNAFVSVSGVDA